MIDWQTYIKENCPWINQSDSLELVKSGHSDAIKFRVRTKKQDYFLKIIKDKSIEEITKIRKIYSDNQIPIPELIHWGYLPKKELYLCYEWIEGSNLKEIQNLSLEEYYSIGYKVGEYIQKLSQYKENISNYYEEFYQNKKENFNQFLKLMNDHKSFFSSKALTFFRSETWKNLYFKYLSFYQNENTIYSHNDIKQSNIIDQGHQIVLIDIENTRFGFLTEFLHADAGKWFGENSSFSKKILKGYLDGYYQKEEIPERILFQLYFQVLDFFIKRMIKSLQKEDQKSCQKIITKYQYFIFNDITENYFEFIKRLEINKNNVKEYVDFIKPDDRIMTVSNSHSGAYCFKIERKKENYFLKIMNGNHSTIEKIKLILKQYQNANIPTNQMLESKTINANLIYVIYEFKEGKNIYELPKENIFIDYEEVGMKVAEYMKRLQKQSINSEIVSKKDLSQNALEVIKETKILLENLNLTLQFSESEWDQIEKVLKTTYQSFVKAKKNIFHDDLKTENILMNDGKLILIDIEGLLYHNEFESFRWAAHQIGDDQKLDRKFYYGFLKAYHTNITIDEIQSLLFIYLLRVLEMIKSCCYSAKEKKINDLLYNFKNIYQKTNGFKIEKWQEYLEN